MSSDERRRREALYPVFVNGGSDGQLEKAFKADIALKLANIRNTCKSPADFEKLVDAVISIITNQEKSFDEIKRTTASEIDKLRSECPKPPSTYHRIASAFRENTDGSLRGPTKEALESITELSGQEMQNLAQTLLDNPRKM